MGHLLSKNGNRGNRLKKRKRKLLKRKKRNCFLQGPCMLCFIVHGNSGSLSNGGGVGDDDDRQSSEVVSGSGSERLAALSSPDDCAKFLLSPRELAIWEGLSAVPARLVVPRALFRATPACEYAEMVCKRKCADVRRCAPCKQPRCCALQEVMENGGGVGGGAGGGGAGDTATAAAHRQLPLCPLPSSASSSTSSSSSSSEGVSGAGPLTDSGESPGSTGSTAAATPRSSSPSCHQDHNHGDAQPGENAADNSSINHLPSSILLKVFSHLSVKERCLCVSLVCKYWRDLCLDFQFWKQIDLSGLQQVTDELLVKIASWKQNVTEINLSDCRNVQDHGVCVLASHCPGLLKYTAYRCKQLSDQSLATVATHCPLLQKAHVGNQDKLTDDALKKLGQCCAELRDIHLGQCYNISDVGMEALAQGCPKLQRIYMQENKLPFCRRSGTFRNNRNRDDADQGRPPGSGANRP
ncbi:hypothetical protein SKAU_G00016060 [Synaphobranchus kaupii]|uniref:F-box domain-containing protein n=1 Tax=Synaphobranchus kaupii TaxID=118154 RepID=A0A9Q1GBZ3_SYNKA|nr:hypothetical protein SKAU_G00016060 [Synaphobranchus kaupii]